MLRRCPPCPYRAVPLHAACSMQNDDTSPGNLQQLQWDPKRIQPLNSSHRARALSIRKHVSHHFPPCNCMPLFAPNHLECCKCINAVSNLAMSQTLTPHALKSRGEKKTKHEITQADILFLSFFLTKIHVLQNSNKLRFEE